MKKNEYKMPHDVAEEAFDEMCEAVGIETDTTYMNEDQVSSLEDSKMKIIKAIRYGKVIIGEDGFPSYIDRDGKTHTFIEPKGSVFLTPVKKNESDMKRMYNIISELTSGTANCGKMHTKDIGILTAIATLFISI